MRVICIARRMDSGRRDLVSVLESSQVHISKQRKYHTTLTGWPSISELFVLEVFEPLVAIVLREFERPIAGLHPSISTINVQLLSPTCTMPWIVNMAVNLPFNCSKTLLNDLEVYSLPSGRLHRLSWWSAVLSPSSKQSSY